MRPRERFAYYTTELLGLCREKELHYTGITDCDFDHIHHHFDKFYTPSSREMDNIKSADGFTLENDFFLRNFRFSIIYLDKINGSEENTEVCPLQFYAGNNIEVHNALNGIFSMHYYDEDAECISDETFGEKPEFVEFFSERILDWTEVAVNQIYRTMWKRHTEKFHFGYYLYLKLLLPCEYAENEDGKVRPVFIQERAVEAKDGGMKDYYNEKEAAFSTEISKRLAFNTVVVCGGIENTSYNSTTHILGRRLVARAPFFAIDLPIKPRNG
jgi:hypothetical protein